MIQHLDPVPFTIENEAHFGLSEVQGLLAADVGRLVIEFRVADTMVGLIKSEVDTIDIPFADVQSIEYRKKFLGMVHRVIIRTRSQRVLEKLPASKQGSVDLVIKKKDGALAEAFCMEVRSAIIHQRNELLQDELNKLE